MALNKEKMTIKIISKNKTTTIHDNENMLFSIDGKDALHETLAMLNVIHKFKKTKPSISTNGIAPTEKRAMALDITLDIDGIFGPLAILDFNESIKFAINLSISKGSIGTKTEYALKDGKAINIRKLSHAKLGFIDMPCGRLSLFYVCSGLERTTNSDVLLNYLTNTVNATSVAKRISVNSYIIHPYNIKAFMQHIYETAQNTRSHHNDFLFVESYGNKDKIVVENINSHKELTALLNANIKLENFPFLKIDLAVSLLENGKIPFISNNFFRKMNAKQNYYLFMNRNLANCHTTLTRLKNNVLNVSASNVDKYNFYSTVEDLLDVVRKYTHTPKITSEIMKSELFNHRPIKSNRKLKENRSKMINMIESLQNSHNREYSFRIEMRIKPFHIESQLQRIKIALEKSMVLLYPVSDLLNSVYNTAISIYREIKVEDTFPIKSLYKSIVAEQFLINTFFKGSGNLQAVTKLVHHRVKSLISTNPSLNFPDINFDTLIDGITNEEMHLTIAKTIRYDEKMNDDQKNTLLNITRIVAFTLSEATEKIIAQYYKDMATRYNLSHNDDTFRLLKTTSHNTTELNEEHMDIMIMRLFGVSQNESWRRLPFRCMLSLYKKEMQVNIPTILNSIKSFYLRNGIDTSFVITNNLRKPVKLFSKLVNITGETIKADTFDTQYLNRKKASLVDEFKSITKPKPKSRKFKWEDEELIRLLAARRIYLSTFTSTRGVWTYITESTLFGFFHLRSIEHMKDAYDRFCEMKNLVKRTSIEKAALIWHPELYTDDNLLECFARFEVECSREAIEVLKEIRKIDFSLYSTLIKPPSIDIIPYNKNPDVNINNLITDNNSSGITLNTLFDLLKDIQNVLKEIKVDNEKNFIEIEKKTMTFIEEELKKLKMSTVDLYAHDSISFMMNDYPMLDMNDDRNLISFPRDDIKDLEEDIVASTALIPYQLNSGSLALIGPIFPKEEIPIVSEIIHKESMSVQNSYIPIMAESPITSIKSENSETNESYTQWIPLLKSKFGFRKFNPLSLRSKYLNYSKRPPLDEWKAFINELERNGIISNVSLHPLIYKFNMKSESERYVTFEYIKKTIQRSMENGVFKYSSVYMNLAKDLRTRKDILDEYLNILLDEDYIQLVRTLNNVHYFTMI